MSAFISNHRFPASAETSKQRRVFWCVAFAAALLLFLRVLTFPIPPANSHGTILLSPRQLGHKASFHASHAEHVGEQQQQHASPTTLASGDNKNNNNNIVPQSMNRIISGDYHHAEEEAKQGAVGGGALSPDEQLVVRVKRNKSPGGYAADAAKLGALKNKPGYDAFGYRLGVPGHMLGAADGARFKIARPNGKGAFRSSDDLAKRKIRFSDETDRNAQNKKRRDQIREEFKFAWKAYEKYAWGWDELHPIKKSPRSWTDNSHGWAMTIFDSLDTLWIMGLKDEFLKGVEFLDKEFVLKQDYGLSTFEATIRMLGGSLSAYELSGDARLLRMAERVGNILIAGLETGNGMLLDHINFKTRRGSQMGWLQGMNLVGEIGTLQMEFRTLSLHIKDPIFDQRVTHLMSVLHSGCESKGFVCPTMFSSGSARPSSASYTLGGMADSYFEYVVKQSVLTGMVEEKLVDMAQTMLKTISENMIASVELHQSKSGVPFRFLFPGMWDGTVGVQSGSRALEHLTCFAGGMFGVAAIAFKNSTQAVRAKYAATASAITETCYNMYASQPSGLSPEEVAIEDRREFATTRNGYFLRPETMESIFYMSRVDKDPQLWRDRGWEIFDSIMTFCRIPWGGYSGLTDTSLSRPPTEAELLSDRGAFRNYYDDLQQSYAHAELFKYAFMLFQDRETAAESKETYIDLEEWVFNTEAHPVRVRQRDPRDVWYEYKAKNGGKARWTAPEIAHVTPFYPELTSDGAYVV